MPAAGDLASGCGKVVVTPGTYTFNYGDTVFVASCPHFEGIGQPIFNASGWMNGDHFFTIQGNIHGVYVGGLIMKGGGTTFDGRGITTTTSPPETCIHCVFENNDIRNVFDGIDAYNQSSDVIVRSNVIGNFGQQGITLQGDRYLALLNGISNGGATNLHHGMYLQAGDGGEAIGNTVQNVTGFCIQAFTKAASITAARIEGNQCIQGDMQLRERSVAQRLLEELQVARA